MRAVTENEFRSWIEGAQVLSSDAHQVKVLERHDGRIVKLFRRKRLISSAIWWPYALRFAAAARELKSRGFETVKVVEVVRLPHLKQYAAVYERLPGEPLREALSGSSRCADSLWPEFARFVAALHQRGVYFRAIHFANVILTEPGRFGLIDVSEAMFYRRPLSPHLRARNFKPMLKYPQDIQALRSYGFDRFVEHYLNEAKLADRQRRRFLAHLERISRARLKMRCG